MAEWVTLLLKALTVPVVIALGVGVLLAVVLERIVPTRYVPAVTRGLRVVGTAAAGAAIGTVLAPGIGTAIGAGVGAIVGFFW